MFLFQYPVDLGFQSCPMNTGVDLGCQIMKPSYASRSISILDAAGWRFFADVNAPANIRLEPRVAIKSTDLDALGQN